MVAAASRQRQADRTAAGETLAASRFEELAAAHTSLAQAKERAAAADAAAAAAAAESARAAEQAAEAARRAVAAEGEAGDLRAALVLREDLIIDQDDRIKVRLRPGKARCNLGTAGTPHSLAQGSCGGEGQGGGAARGARAAHGPYP